MSIIELSETNFDDVIDGDQVIFLDFWAPWCAPCKQFLEVIEKGSELFPDVVFATVNVDEQEELAKGFKIMSVPHLMVMKQGVVIYSQSGVLSLATIKELAEQAKTANV